MARDGHRDLAHRVFLGAGLALGLSSCQTAGGGADGSLGFPSDGGGKTDVLGRDLVGVAAPYTPDPRLQDPAVAQELHTNVRARRDQAWKTIHQTLEPVPLLGLAEAAEQSEEIELPDGEVPRVPRWQTWYGVDDMKRMFQGLYGGLTPADRNSKASFSSQQMDEIETWNAGALERSNFWPLERYLRTVKDLFEDCPDGQSPEECALAQQSQFSGVASGIARITYSPGMTLHVLGNYAPVLECLASLDTLPRDEPLADDRNFSHCFESEFPPDAVLIKAQWARTDFNADIPIFDTTAEALSQRLGASSTADWGSTGDRRGKPGPEEAYTISLRSGSTFRLTGLHIMTKELRHWQWITMWWSDTPDEDFGADRPEGLFADLPPVWSNYKMCVATDYVEGDPDPAGRYADHPSLGQALAATATGGQPSWCSNPYIEHGRGNARTNCIGCHQHGGATVDMDWDGDSTLDKLDLETVIDDEMKFPSNGRTEIRSIFPADYLWSFSRIDDFSHLFAAEVDHVDHSDQSAIGGRIDTILAIDASPDRGQTVFESNCTDCHGTDGTGGFGPSLFERVPPRDDEALLTSILLGRGDMPEWADEINDQGLADLRAFLRATFG